MSEAGVLQRREAILEYLEHLIREGEALGRVISVVPEDILVGSPGGGEATIKEMLGSLLALHDSSYLPFVQLLSGDPRPLSEGSHASPAIGVDWNDVDVSEILEQLVRKRQDLLFEIVRHGDHLWYARAPFRGSEVSMAEFARMITEADLDMLREIGLRLHAARLTSRQPLL